AVKRIQKRQAEEKPRLSPITGEPMAQKSFMGVVVDICETSGGIWLDSGELDQIINLTKETDQGKENLLSRFFSDLFHTK
ncbi:MAG: zf-TFIIB domain-containing protein, partial [Bdellovibrionales bacterium]|nr:zf-TFIIB domain-containing protein [Bdellovibrionales bacterium]